MSTVRAVVFDFNGTLSHDEPILYGVYRDMFSEHGRPLTETDYYGTLAGLSAEAIIGMLHPSHRGRRRCRAWKAGSGRLHLRARAASTPAGRVTLVIAHRGASWELPENTLPAFERAIELRADYVEFDVHAARDGALVVCHDPPRGSEPRLEEVKGRRVLQHVGPGVSIRSAARYAWAVGFHNPRVTPRGLAKARSLGLATTVYTVNDRGRMRELAALGVDGIFSDRPDLLRATLLASQD